MSVFLNTHTVPVYDGREKFQLGNHWDQPYTGEPPKGSMVMLLFSVKKGNLPKGVKDTEGFPTDIEFGTYLHVLGVVVLAEPVDRFSDVPSGEAAPAFGVREIAQLPEPEEEAVEEPFM